ncbi:hypothetical protein E2C01_023371 [Portunus trituberculatus]|uniref:Uncharacterized protein n=1 Tax=Portunus trituberculatus TaxID=210409 RepID=A0A5B7E806_PORTR|nr:hypothetical protein [Portunus trituberculatus]
MHGPGEEREGVSDSLSFSLVLFLACIHLHLQPSISSTSPAPISCPASPPPPAADTTTGRCAPRPPTPQQWPLAATCSREGRLLPFVPSPVAAGRARAQSLVSSRQATRPPPPPSASIKIKRSIMEEVRRALPHTASARPAPVGAPSCQILFAAQ